jgi:anti-sigma-K factor RskA
MYGGVVMTIFHDDDIALAGEYVLGLLDSATEASAAARIATDAEFAAEVEAWRRRLQPIVDGNDTPAPPVVWRKVMAALPEQSGQDNAGGNVRLWRALAGLSTSAAAILAVILLQQPAPVAPPEPRAPLIAALGSETGQASLTARYDAGNGQMLLTPVSLDTGELYPELWIIPADGKPRSLGIVSGDKPSQISIDAKLRDFIDQGATLAITPEPQTGGPGGLPSGPVIASGKIVAI